MPMRGELVAPAARPETADMDSELLLVTVFCLAGLVLSFVFIAYTDAFEQIADLASTYLWG